MYFEQSIQKYRTFRALGFNLLLWEPSQGKRSGGRPCYTYVDQLMEDTGLNKQSSKRRVFVFLCSNYNLLYCICLCLLKLLYNTHPQRLLYTRYIRVLTDDVVLEMHDKTQTHNAGHRVCVFYVALETLLVEKHPGWHVLSLFWT